jgi:cell division protein FtsI/penicillin-binding protein 2
MQLQDSPADIQRRLPLLAAFVIIFTVVLFVRLWYLQAVKGEYYLEQAESNRIRPVKLRPPRGIMYDAKAAHRRERAHLRYFVVPRTRRILKPRSKASHTSR